MNRSRTIKSFMARAAVMILTVSALRLPAAALAAEGISYNTAACVSYDNAAASLSLDESPAASDNRSGCEPEASEGTGAAGEPSGEFKIESVVLTQIMADGSEGDSYTVPYDEFGRAGMYGSSGCRYVDHRFGKYACALKITINVPDEYKGSAEYIYDWYGYSFNGHSTGRIKSDTCIRYNYGVYKISAIYTPGGDASEEKEVSYIVGSHDIDMYSPVLDSVRFVSGDTVVKGKCAYGDIVIKAHDDQTGMNTTGYYVGGTWQSGNICRVKKNGLYQIIIKDACSNYTWGSISVDCIDNVPPSGTVSERIGELTNGYCRSSSISADASDDTALDGKPFCFNAGTWTDEPEQKVSCNGIYKVKIRDVFGNETIKLCTVSDIDSTPPVIASVETLLNAPCNGFALEGALTVKASDNEAGLDNYPYSFDGGVTWQRENFVMVSENCTADIMVRDVFGNTGRRKNIAISGIDRSGPVLDKVIVKPVNAAGKYMSAIRLNVKASDEGSGLAEKYCSFDGGRTWSDEPSYTVSENGTVMLRVRDMLENISAKDIEAGYIDNTAPECSVIGNPASLTLEKAVLTVEASDDEAGLKSISIMNDKAGIKTEVRSFAADKAGAGPQSGHADIKITANGDYTVFVTDMCGNERIVTERVTKLVNPEEDTDDSGDDDSDEDDDGDGNGDGNDVYDGGEIVISGSRDNGNASGTQGGKTIFVRNTMRNAETLSAGSIHIGGSTVSGYERYYDEGSGVYSEDTDISSVSGETVQDSGDIRIEAEETEDEMTEHFISGNLAGPGSASMQHSEKKDFFPIAVTAAIMMLSLAALSVFLLYRKGIIGQYGGTKETS